MLWHYIASSDTFLVSTVSKIRSQFFVVFHRLCCIGTIPIQWHSVVSQKTQGLSIFLPVYKFKIVWVLTVKSEHQSHYFMCWRVYSVFTGKLDYQAIQNGATWCDTSPVKTFIHLGSRDDDSCQFPVWKDKKSVWSKISAAITMGNAVSFWHPWRRGELSCPTLCAIYSQVLYRQGCRCTSGMIIPVIRIPLYWSTGMCMVPDQPFSWKRNLSWKTCKPKNAMVM